MRGVWLAVVLALLPLLAGPAAADIVTMRNGDVHHGTVAARAVVVEAPYGTITLPYARLARLAFDPRVGVERVFTRDGGRFSGRLAIRRLTVLRVVEAPLDVHVDDIAEIAFGDHRLKPALVPTPDAVEMQNGDTFRARLVGGDLMVMTDGGPRLVGRGDIHLLDAEPAVDGPAVRVRIDLNTPGEVVAGTLMGGSLTVRLRPGQDLELPTGELAALGVGVLVDPLAEGAFEFCFRRRVNPAAVIRDRLRDGSPGPPMVVVRGGRFQRGDGQGDGDADERPVGEVTLSRPFAIGMFEITFDAYDRFVAATNRIPPDDGGLGRGRRPVVNVSWEDAAAYADWLSEQTGRTYRLPTDAEWEFAARGGTDTRFWWGDAVGAARANCAGCGSLWDGVRAVRVGRFPPNPFGLHDTAGNVFEWVADCWHDSFAEAPADGTAIDKPGCGKRVIRGGAWSFPPEEVRSANRWRDFPSRSSDDTGFRLVRELQW